jgi:hypothetical protein
MSKLHREPRKILLPGRNYNEPFEPFYTIEDIRPLTKYSYEINGQKFEFNHDSQILTFEINVDGIIFNGRINYSRLYSSEYPYESFHHIYIRKNNGSKIWLKTLNQFDIWWNEEFEDEKQIEL